MLREGWDGERRTKPSLRFVSLVDEVFVFDRDLDLTL